MDIAGFQDKNEKRSTSQTAFLLSGFVIFRSVLGFLSQMVVARSFGASALTDAYFLSLLIPQTIGESIIGATLSLAMVPVSHWLLEEKGKQAQDWFHTVNLLLVITVTCALAFLYAFFARFLMMEVGVGFHEKTLQNAVRMAHFFSLILVCSGISNFCASIFLIYRRYFFAGIAAFLYPLMILSFCLFMGPALGSDRLMYGTLMGGILQASCSLAFVFFLKPFGLVPVSVMGAMKRMAGMLTPLVLTVILSTLVSYQQRYLASHLAEGAVSCFSYANMIYAIPGYFMFSSLQTVLYPKFSEQAAQLEGQKNLELTYRSLRFIFFLGLPLAGMMIVLRRTIIFLVFQRGSFTEHATLTTAAALGVMLVGFVAHLGMDILSKVYYAEQKPWNALRWVMTAQVIGFILNIYFVRILGFVGLALGFSSICWFSFAALLIDFVKHHSAFEWKKLVRFALKICAYSVVIMVAIFFSAPKVFPMPLRANFIPIFIWAILFMSVGGLAYLLAATLTHISEAKQIWALFDLKNWRKRSS